MPNEHGPKVAVEGHGLLAVTTRRALGPMLHGRSETADLMWFCEDTPVDENDVGDTEWMVAHIDRCASRVPSNIPIMISSQLPVGTCRLIEQLSPEHTFIVQPENIRREHADTDFHWQARMVVGRRSKEHDDLIRQVLSCFTATILWMTPESAEMTKHALNGWLALGIAYANEIADLCTAVGADKDDVSRGWRSDARVGTQPLAYGLPFTGGTLGRDVRVMEGLTTGTMPIISQIRFSNSLRKL